MSATFTELTRGADEALRQLKTKVPAISGGDRDAAKVANDDASRIIRGASYGAAG